MSFFLAMSPAMEEHRIALRFLLSFLGIFLIVLYGVAKDFTNKSIVIGSCSRSNGSGCGTGAGTSTSRAGCST